MTLLTLDGPCLYDSTNLGQASCATRATARLTSTTAASSYSCRRSPANPNPSPNYSPKPNPDPNPNPNPDPNPNPNQELFRYLSETRPYETYVVTLPEGGR